MSGFLRRWAERKAETRQNPAQPDPQAELPPPAEIDAAGSAPEGEGAAFRGSAAEALPPAAAALDAEEIAARLAELPALDEIDAATDVRPLLQDFVPAALRNAALRRAWALDPVISTHLDVARDYAWDFNGGANPVGFYSTLDSESVKRGLAALRGDDAAPAGPEMADTPPEADATETTAKPDDLEKIDTEQADSQAPLLLSRRHGGALPG